MRISAKYIDRMKSKEELKAQGKVDHEGFKKLFNGNPHNDIPRIVEENNLSYGTLEYGDDNLYGHVDINYKSICGTVRNKNGICQVTCFYEVYDENGQVCDKVID